MTAERGADPAALERLLATGRDGALLRMGLALAYHRREDYKAARMHVEQALVFDPDFAAAGRLKGLIALACGDTVQASAAFTDALAAAQRRGDYQLAKELTVRLRRLQPPPVSGEVVE
jgi:Tfp pilus assembly protein PilF